MSNIHDIGRDDDISGEIIGGNYLRGAVFYDGRRQSTYFYEEDDCALRAKADAFIEEKRAEGHEVFNMIWPKPLWELRIND